DLEEVEVLNFSEHLSLGNNKESDFDAFRASFPVSGIFKLINSRGLVINWDYAKQTGTWSHEELNSPFWSLPGILPEPILAKLQSLEKENPELKLNNSILEDSNKNLNEDLCKYQVTVAKLEKQIKHLKEQVASSKSIKP
ncbi:hypothetical protein MKW92_048263, partial [Papaver armeniacum]